MDLLKLAALDEQDLVIVSAHAQDAVTKVGELRFDPAAGRFLVPIRRFAWEKSGGWLKPGRERHAAVLQFDRVLSARTAGISRHQPETVLSLLAIRFHPDTAPSGEIELLFSAEGVLRLAVECIEVRLADLGAAWEAASRPVHKV